MGMNRDQLRRVLEDELKVPAGTLADACELKDVSAWDSMGILAVIAAMDHHLKVEIPADKLTNCKTMAEVLDLVKDKLD